MIIYKITNKINGKIYIGQTIRSLNKRIYEHLARGRNTYFDRALHKYGIQNFNIEVIDYAENKDELNKKESYYIKFFNCKFPFGYNLTDGGEGTIGIRRFGKDNPHYNKKHTKEAKEKISKARKLYTKEKHPLARKIINLDTGEIFNCMVNACEKYKLDKSTLTKVCKGKRNKCGGYHWKYV